MCMHLHVISYALTCHIIDKGLTSFYESALYLLADKSAAYRILAYTP